MQLAKRETALLALALATIASTASASRTDVDGEPLRATHVERVQLEAPRFALALERSVSLELNLSDVASESLEPRLDLAHWDSKPHVRAFDFGLEKQPQRPQHFELEIASGAWETGFLYARNRFYDPEIGRFISADPLGYIDGPSVYSFAFNDPINASDPMGLSGDWAIETRAAQNSEREAQRQREYEAWCASNPAACQERATRNAGVARAAGGIAQCVSGAAAISSGAGAVAGGIAIGRCVDNVATGVKQAWTGEEQRSALGYGINKTARALGANEREAAVAEGVGEFGADIGVGVAATRAAMARPAAPNTRAEALVTWVDEGGNLRAGGNPGMKPDAYSHQSGAAGARSNALTGRGQAAYLEFTDSSGKVVGAKFDGAMGAELIERKLNPFFSPKAVDQAVRQAAVAKHYGLQAVWELPTPAAVSAANRFLTINEISGISVKLAP